MSVCTYSTRWPTWIGPLAYGRALVTRMVSDMGRGNVVGHGLDGLGGSPLTSGDQRGHNRHINRSSSRRALAEDLMARSTSAQAASPASRSLRPYRAAACMPA